MGLEPLCKTAGEVLLGDAGDTEDNPIPIAIETPRGLMVAALRASGRPAFAIIPMAVAMVVLPGPGQQHYRRRRDHGDRHTPAIRHLFNKMLGQLYYCLQTCQTYDPVKAFGDPVRGSGSNRRETNGYGVAAADRR